MGGQGFLGEGGDGEEKDLHISQPLSTRAMDPQRENTWSRAGSMAGVSLLKQRVYSLCKEEVGEGQTSIFDQLLKESPALHPK